MIPPTPGTASLIEVVWQRFMALPLGRRVVLWALLWPFLLGWNLFRPRRLRPLLATAGVATILLGTAVQVSLLQAMVAPGTVPVVTTTPTPTDSPTPRPTPTPSPTPIPSPEPAAHTTAAGMAMPAPPPGAIRARVAEVTDGDTVVLDGIGVGSEKRGIGRRARLIGIDTPEVHRGVDCYGPEASAFAKRELGGREVLVDFDVERTDRFGRALVYLWTLDGRFFNGRLAAEGYALQATYPPNVRYAELFTALVREAREADRGLWSGCPVATTAPPPGAPEGDFDVTFTHVTSPVRAGDRAGVSVSTAAGAHCTITVTYKGGPSRARGLDPRSADGSGSVSWTWTVGSSTTKGDWPIDVSCTHGDRRASNRTHFTVT